LKKREKKAMAIVGSGAFRYERIPEWPQVPKHWDLGEPSDAAVNSTGEIYVLSRAARHPVTIWSTDGRFISSWGEGAFSAMPHGIYIGMDDNVWVVDRDYHIAIEFTPGGDTIRTLGRKLAPSPTCDGRVVKVRPFNMPANLAIAGNGDIFVADGYGGHKVHRFGADGTLQLSWGRQGMGPGEFALVHNVWIDSLNRVFIADDENDRVQIFDRDGTYLTEWKFANPSGLCIHDDLVYVAELQPFADVANGLGSGSVCILNLDGELQARWVGTDGPNRDVLIGPHDLCVDGRGDIYVCEPRGRRVSKFRKLT
jgi:hypothetical protein